MGQKGKRKVLLTVWNVEQFFPLFCREQKAFWSYQSTQMRKNSASRTLNHKRALKSFLEQNFSSYDTYDLPPKTDRTKFRSVSKIVPIIVAQRLNLSVTLETFVEHPGLDWCLSEDTSVNTELQQQTVEQNVINVTCKTIPCSQKGIQCAATGVGWALCLKTFKNIQLDWKPRETLRWRSKSRNVRPKFQAKALRSRHTKNPGASFTDGKDAF